MAEQAETRRTALDTIEEHEKYLLRSKAEIARVLLDLSKKPDIITAYFNEGKEYLLTAVIKVLPDRNLVALDYGAEETLNRRALAAGRLVCVTKQNNVAVRFTLTGLKRAKLRGSAVFAAPIPPELFRLQRREFFRIGTPTVTPITCLIPTPRGNATLTAVDISCGGVGLIDPTLSFPAEPGDVLKGCRIAIPDSSELEVDLEVRSVFKQRQKGGSDAIRIGCAFVKLSMEQNALIQRYINRLQIERKAISDE